MVFFLHFYYSFGFGFRLLSRVCTNILLTFYFIEALVDCYGDWVVLDSRLAGYLTLVIDIY